MLLVMVRMTDKAPVTRFAQIVIGTPPNIVRRAPRKPMWDKTIGGMRALTVLEEILPFLYGKSVRRLKEPWNSFLQAAITRDCFGIQKYGPRAEFPLRRKGGRKPSKAQ